MLLDDAHNGMNFEISDSFLEYHEKILTLSRKIKHHNDTNKSNQPSGTNYHLCDNTTYLMVDDCHTLTFRKVIYLFVVDILSPCYDHLEVGIHNMFKQLLKQGDNYCDDNAQGELLSPIFDIHMDMESSSKCILLPFRFIELPMFIVRNLRVRFRMEDGVLIPTYYGKYTIDPQLLNSTDTKLDASDPDSPSSDDLDPDSPSSDDSS